MQNLSSVFTPIKSI